MSETPLKTIVHKMDLTVARGYVSMCETMRTLRMGEELERMWQRAVSISSTELPRKTNTAFPAKHHPARFPPQPQLMPHLTSFWAFQLTGLYIS